VQKRAIVVKKEKKKTLFQGLFIHRIIDNVNRGNLLVPNIECDREISKHRKQKEKHKVSEYNRNG
jgi:hypothetical protein